MRRARNTTPTYYQGQLGSTRMLTAAEAKLNHGKRERAGNCPKYPKSIPTVGNLKSYPLRLLHLSR